MKLKAVRLTKTQAPVRRSIIRFMILKMTPSSKFADARLA